MRNGVDGKWGGFRHVLTLPLFRSHVSATRYFSLSPIRALVSFRTHLVLTVEFEL